VFSIDSQAAWSAACGDWQISGHVGDEVGAVVGKASVFVRRYSPTENGVELVTHSDGQGNFVVTLAPGAYDVLVTSAGFMSKMQTVVVQAGKTQKLEWKLTAQPCDFPTANCDTFR
jgi:uncharacterized membrane protein